MKRTYRGKPPKPDRLGYFRPEVGGKRFTLGHQRDLSQGEVERRLSSLRDLFDRQCKRRNITSWAPDVLPFAKKIASGERLVFTVSDHARITPGQASEEVQALYALQELGLDIQPDDPAVVVSGKLELKDVIDSKVRAAVTQAIGEASEWIERKYPKSAIDELRSPLPPDPAAIESRTFHQAIDAYRDYRRKTGKRIDNGKLSGSVENDLRNASRLKKATSDFPVWELQKNKVDELFAHWRNRPISEVTKQRISATHSKHTMDCLWAILVWLDEEDGWRWSLPKGARRIKRTPESLDSDRKALRTRRISKSTYSPDQLAIIARELKPLGKLALGLCVNCAMQPAECGRLEIEDFYVAHPETGVVADWIIFDRPKTFEYGEWVLWPEVAALVRWGIQRSKRLNCDRLIVSNRGVVWYREEKTHPEATFAKWWHRKATTLDPTRGIVTRLSEEIEGFPRYTIKFLRKILPNLVRPKYGKEISDLVNARKINRSGQLGPGDTDRYSDRPYDRVAEAIRELEDHFRPFLNELRIDPKE